MAYNYYNQTTKIIGEKLYNESYTKEKSDISWIKIKQCVQKVH